MSLAQLEESMPAMSQEEQEAAWHRAVPDNRSERCKKAKYKVEKLPRASIIICTAKDIPLLLGRTIASLLDRTPRSLLAEIILIDDGNERPIHPHVVGLAPELIRFVRNDEPQGLIRARNQGAEMARGDVLVFLDSHIEPVVGWLEPLLQRIHENPQRVVIPVIDIIDDVPPDWRYVFIGGRPQFGGFTHRFYFNWVNELKLATRSNEHPFETPAMAGGLYAIDRRWFARLGAYDPHMNVWGGENIEFSVRVWACGGSLEIHPCSHIGHVFRVHHRPPFDTSQWFRKNTERFIYTWLMDEGGDSAHFVSMFEKADGFPLKKGHDYWPPAIDQRKRFLFAADGDLRCKSFDWYARNIYPELFDENYKGAASNS